MKRGSDTDVTLAPGPPPFYFRCGFHKNLEASLSPCKLPAGLTPCRVGPAISWSEIRGELCVTVSTDYAATQAVRGEPRNILHFVLFGALLRSLRGVCFSYLLDQSAALRVGRLEPRRLLATLPFAHAVALFPLGVNEQRIWPPRVSTRWAQLAVLFVSSCVTSFSHGERTPAPALWLVLTNHHAVLGQGGAPATVHLSQTRKHTVPSTIFGRGLSGGDKLAH